MDALEAHPGNVNSLHFRQLLGDQWEGWMRWDPLFATSCGDNRYNDLLPAAGEEHFVSWREQLATFRQRLEKIDRQTLPAADHLNSEIFARLLEYEIAGLDHHGYRLPLSKSGGFHLSFPDLYLLSPFITVRDYENFLARTREAAPLF